MKRFRLSGNFVFNGEEDKRSGSCGVRLAWWASKGEIAQASGTEEHFRQRWIEGLVDDDARGALGRDEAARPGQGEEQSKKEIALRRNLIAPAVIVALGIIVAELMNGGFYDVRTVSGATVIWRVNKITGATYFCSGIDEQNDDIYQGCIRLSEYNLAKIADLARFVRDHPELYASPTSKPTPRP